ncbi:hypothetical protein [Hymenobacter jeollabukensis]|uniref:Uncharacterized protein n=1 Tax=Hymenobacter jeollabukensis TaxID=2025313 RepID=A0A5R8WS21_9BACT|nr:hypothetical protein [Hymenobacter jeollabukensis]TLM93965.1 hypothetical protein FDY95_07995 [Hymenobacter jeollabukensis]
MRSVHFRPAAAAATAPWHRTRPATFVSRHARRPAEVRRLAAPALRGGDVRDFLSLLALAGGIVLWVVVGGWAGAGLFALSLLVILGIMLWGFGKGDMP